MSSDAVIDLNPYVSPYAYWTHATDPQSSLPVPGIGAHLFAFFCEPGRNPAGAKLSALELFAKPAVSGAEERRADVVTVILYNSPEPRGEVVFEGRLNWRGDVARIELPGVPALAASVRCHWKHPVCVSPYQLHPEPWAVSFGLFDGAKWFGRRLSADRRPMPEPPVKPMLEIGKLEPKSSSNALRAWQDGHFAHFESDVLKVSFSLIRPRTSYLAWDLFGTKRLSRNFLVDKHAAFGSGPMVRDLGSFSPPMHWGGNVEVVGNSVRYTDLTCHDGLSLDAIWTIEPDGIHVEMKQRNDRARTLLDAASWRFVWDGTRTYSLATLAEPVWGESRNGMTKPRGGWHAVSQGTLSFDLRGEGQHHCENLGFFGHKAMSDFQVGGKCEPFGPVTFQLGAHSASISMKLTNIEPSMMKESAKNADVHTGVRRAWGTMFAFRPEHGGFSNNAHSANCNHVQSWPADVMCYTATSADGVVPSMLSLMRHTIDLALRGGPGCASQFETMLDSATSLVIAAGRCHQVDRDQKWLTNLWPWLRRAVVYVLDNIDETGMYTSKLRSGNSVPYGSPHPPSSNAWDCVGFGHHDGYGGTLGYRALKCGVALARDAGDAELSSRCDVAAQMIRGAFAKDLFNPKTGWLAGWRSRDGQLHDPACWYVTAAAACYDMLDDNQARDMLGKLEEARIARRITDFHFGIPTQWDPIPLADTRIESYDRPFACGGDFVPTRTDGADTYGIFTNGGAALGFAHYYLRALSKYGFTHTADQICTQLEESLDDALFDGPPGDGCEAYSLDGMKTGYEGTLVTLFGIVVPIAQHRGWIKTLEPEWWPE